MHIATLHVHTEEHNPPPLHITGAFPDRAYACHVTNTCSPSEMKSAATDLGDFSRFCEQYSLLPPQKQYDVVWRLLEKTEVQYP